MENLGAETQSTHFLVVTIKTREQFLKGCLHYINFYFWIIVCSASDIGFLSCFQIFCICNVLCSLLGNTIHSETFFSCYKEVTIPTGHHLFCSSCWVNYLIPHITLPNLCCDLTSTAKAFGCSAFPSSGLKKSCCAIAFTEAEHTLCYLASQTFR